MPIALYPGSFDPVTRGHLDIIKRAARNYEKLIVAVLINSEKAPLFTVEERVDMLRECCADIANVSVGSFDGLTVNYAKRQVGNRVYGGQTSHLPLKLNMSGVIPPIFASSIILFPATLAQWFTSGEGGGTMVRVLKDLAATLSLSLLLKSLSKEVTTILNEADYVHELFVFLDEDFTGAQGTRGPVENETLTVEFRDVLFRYPRGEKNVFENLSLTIREGERLALVGVNGAGKSTLVKLMTGLFRPTEGEIFINGIPIGEFSKKALFSMFSAVFQEVNVLAYTVLENVAATDEGDRARAEEALRKAGLWEKVASLPNGLDTVMLKVIDEEGAIFSGGEAQKLAIARALYKDAKMVVMDEPTAALDALAEQEIYERFGELTRGKTALYISHRLASTRFCDRIVLLDGARIAELGTHAELMALRGKYYEMFTVQGKYYTQGAEGAIS